MLFLRQYLERDLGECFLGERQRVAHREPKERPGGMRDVPSLK